MATRQKITEMVGEKYHTANIEEDEWSYVKDAGSKAKLEKAVGHSIQKGEHYKLDRRFVYEDKTGTYVVLIETKQDFKDSDADQLKAYLEEERALHSGEKIICILANTNNDRIRVWKSEIDDQHLLPGENMLQRMSHYVSLFTVNRQNDREQVMKNTYALNELLHKKDIDEAKRSQFVGTCLLFVKNQINTLGNGASVDSSLNKKLKDIWSAQQPKQIRSGIEAVLDNLLDGTKNKDKKVKLLQENILRDSHIRRLKTDDWIEILSAIMNGIYKYIDDDSSEGQDILNLFFITFNKYTGKADKNQAFTPDHITDFMCRLTGVNKDSVVLDECCGSGSFLVQAMVQELADCQRNFVGDDFENQAKKIKQEHIYGIECEEKAYGLATTNMLIHSDGNSNVEFGSCFDKEQFIKDAHPTIILMNPPYNAKPIGIPERYKKNWTAKEVNGKEDPTKGFVFVKYLSDIAKESKWEGTKLAVLLPMSAAIGSNKRLTEMKTELLNDNTLEAVFSLPAEIFYPGASVQACCMLFTLNRPHFDSNGVPNKKTFFGYYKDDGFKKKKNLGRVEQFDSEGHSKWKAIEKEWLDLYKNREVKAGLSATHAVTGKDEWLCEAYMQTDYSKLTEEDFQQTINDYLSYLVKTGKVTE